MRAKIISSLEKCFLDENVMQKPQLKSPYTVLKNERASFQVCFDEPEEYNAKRIALFRVESPLKDFTKLYHVESIPSTFPVYGGGLDDNYLRTEPGLYPDLLAEMKETDRLPVRKSLLSIWVEIDLCDISAGCYPFKGIFLDEAGQTICEVETEIEVIDALLPAQKTIFTQWFYTDCLMQYYGTEAFSDEHWRIIDNFMGNASRYGMNMILTPLLSPELDTYIGGYRPETQLVKVILEDGKYTFDFSRLEKWVELCRKNGIVYYEVSHFFTQWGAEYCPQVWAEVNGEHKRIFGWDTYSESEEYKGFLNALIPEFLRFMKGLGVDKNCYFHISDEPHIENIEKYRRCSDMIRPLVEGYHIMDAMSNYDIYSGSSVDIPVPGCNHMDDFLAGDVENLWTYYCCAQCTETSNRFFAMPSARTRIIGIQMYKYDVKGFLHWGYNFYNNQYSHKTVNPFICSDGECFAPSGDTYSVYPGFGGVPQPSLRQSVFFDALQDIRALELCESLYGREFTLNLIDEGIEPITFTSYPHDAEYILNLRRKVNEAIKNHK